MNPSLALSLVAVAGLVVVALALAAAQAQIRLLRQQVASLRKLSGIEAKLVEPDIRQEVVSALGPGTGGAVVLVVDEGCSICDEVVPVFLDSVNTSPDGFAAAVVSRRPLERPHEEGRRVTMIADTRLHHHLDPGYLPALHVLTPDGHAALTEPVGSREGLVGALALAGIATAK